MTAHRDHKPQLGQPNGIATLDGSTEVPASQHKVMVGDSGSGGVKGAAPAPAAGDAAAGKFLKADGTWSSLDGGDSQSVTEDFTKVGHGLAVKDVVRHAGPNPEDWVKAKADTGDNAEALGVISAVDGDDFTITYSGRIEGLSGLTAGSTHFLSDATAGALTTTAPDINKPILFATSATAAIVLINRGMQTSEFSSNIVVRDEGVVITTAVKEFDFVGNGVTVTETATDEVEVNIPGLATGDMSGVVAGNTAQQELSVGSYGTLNWDTTNFENDDSVVSHDPVTNNSRLVAHEAGPYLIFYSLTFDPPSSVSQLDTRVIKNGVATSLPGSNRMMAEDDEPNDCSNVFMAELEAGDYIELQGQCSLATSHIREMSNFGMVLMKGPRGEDGPVGPQGPAGGTPTYCFEADAFQNPVNADWAVNSLAPASADTNNAGLVVRRFADSGEEGVGFSVFVPVGMTNIILKLKSRAETAASGDVVPKLYSRAIPDNAAVGAWSSGTDLTAVAMTSNEFFHYDEETISLATLGLNANELAQLELTRNSGAAGDTLTGDWSLLELQVTFS